MGFNEINELREREITTNFCFKRKAVIEAKDGKEVPLKTYEEFQNPELFDQAVFTEGIKRVSQRDYEKGVRQIANSFGIKNSASCLALLNDLENRGLQSQGIMFIVDGGSGLNKALEEKYLVDDKKRLARAFSLIINKTEPWFRKQGRTLTYRQGTKKQLL